MPIYQLLNQSTVTFEVFVLWLRNQDYYTCNVKMRYRDFPYYEGIRAKTHHEYKLHENKHKNLQALHTFRKWSPVHLIQLFKALADSPIQWRVQPCTAYVILMQWNMADRAWIVEA